MVFLEKLIRTFRYEPIEKKMKIVLLNQEARMPTVAYDGESAALDFYSSGEYRILGNEIKIVHLDIKVIIPKGYFLMLYNKSSIEFKCHLKLLGGVIDRGFTGPLDCRFKNHSNEEITIEKHQKVCQGFLLPSYKYNIEECSLQDFWAYENTCLRREKGFGSTNKE